MKKIREKGLLTGLISNSFSDERDLILGSPLYSLFDVTMISYETGLYKPDPAVFKAMIEKLGVKPEQCLYIGDGGSRELYGARDAGMNAVQCTWFAKLAFEPHIPCKLLDEFEHVAHQMDILNIIDRLGKETLPWLPESVRRGVEGKPFTVDDVGRSGSQIFIFDDCVLKIVPYDEKNELAEMQVCSKTEGKEAAKSLA